MYKILICDDERDIRNALRIYLTGEGYAVCEADSGLAALELMQREEVQLVLMDIMMPGMDGMTATAKLREQSNVPVILITAKSEDNDKILGLTVGADDYITKPFSPREVLARVKAVLRRLHEIKDESKGTIVRIENLEIDMSAFIVKLNDQPVPCTPKEIEILYTLASNPGKVFSREHLLQSIWGYDFLGDTRAVDSHIKRMRAKLCLPENRWDIKTVWGVGYRFEIGE